MRGWTVVMALLLSLSAAADAAGQRVAVGTAHLSVSSVMTLDVVPGGGSARVTGSYVELEGAVLLRVRSNGPWRLDVDAALAALPAGEANGLAWRATVVEGEGETVADYQVVKGTSVVVASGARRGEVLVRIDYRWLAATDPPANGLIYTLAAR
jgi:hypothetical protein